MHGRRRNQTGEGNSLALILLLGIHEEKCLVAADGPSDRAAKLVQIELRGCSVKVALRVEGGVADELEDRSMEVICTRLGSDQHGRAGAGAIFRGITEGEHFEFRDIVDGS